MVFAVTRIAHRLTDKNNAMSGINYLDRVFRSEGLDAMQTSGAIFTALRFIENGGIGKLCWRFDSGNGSRTGFPG
jgi:hypothetical protein